MMRIKNITRYISVFLLLAISGNPNLTRASWYQDMLVFLGALISIIVVYKLQKTFIRKISIYILFFLGIFLIQYLNFNWNTLPGIFGFALKCIIGGYIIWRLKANFVLIYTNIMVFISIVSLVLFLASSFNIFYISNIFPVLNSPDVNSIGFYIESNSIVARRNYGMFWEPGAYAGYIVLAFILNFQRLRNGIKEHKFKYISLFVALISTFSTTGYIVLSLFFVVIGFNFLKRNWLFGIVSLAIIIPLIYFTFIKQDFLLEKISSQYESSLELEGEYDPSRFGALFFDLHYIRKNPLTGNGLHAKTRYADHPYLWNERLGHGNGFSNFIASMGILSLMFYMIILYKSLPFYRKERFFSIIFVILLLQSEPYLNYPLFLGLPFLNFKIST